MTWYRVEVRFDVGAESEQEREAVISKAVASLEAVEEVFNPEVTEVLDEGWKEV
jgi:hypothetical protein